MVNGIDFSQYDVTVQTIYDRGELRKNLHPEIRYKTIIHSSNKYIEMLKSYFIRRIVAPEKTYRKYIDDDYDYAVAFLEGECTRLISGCRNDKTTLYAWVHVDFMKLFSSNGVYQSKEEHLKTYLKYDKIVCCSEGVANGFIKRFDYDFGNKLVVKYNVINGERIIAESAEKCEYKFSKDIFNIVCIGNMRKQKAYDRLLKICKRLKDEGYKYHLAIIGRGSEWENIRSLHNDFGLEGYVSLLGNQSNPYKYLIQADMLLVASYTEGFSTVLIESIMLNIPAVVTDCAGMDEILDNGKYGIIIPNNEDAIYKQLKEILSNTMIIENYKKILSERKTFFDKEQSMKEVMELFTD